MNKRLKGGKIEQQIAVWLQSQDYHLIKCNYRCPRGEIDLIAEDNGILVFIEVRSRRGRYLGTPEESITLKKQNRIVCVANWYLAENRPKYKAIRFDVAAVDVNPNGEIAAIRLYKDAFRVSYI